MYGTFQFNGINSRDFNLVTRSVKRPIFPQMRPRTAEVYGKHGIIDFGGNTMGTRQITMHIAYIADTYIELREMARQIAAWINTSQWAPLIIDDEPDKYYLARIYGEIDFESLQRLGECDIVFLCQPFAFLILNTNENPSWEDLDIHWLFNVTFEMNNLYNFTVNQNSTFQFFNPGTVIIGNNAPDGAIFNIILTGSWSTVSISLNGKTLNYNQSGSGILTINNVDMEVDLDGVNKLSFITGNLDSFLHVIPRDNSIAITGTNLNFSLAIDFSPMWY